MFISELSQSYLVVYGALTLIWVTVFTLFTTLIATDMGWDIDEDDYLAVARGTGIAGLAASAFYLGILIKSREHRHHLQLGHRLGRTHRNHPRNTHRTHPTTSTLKNPPHNIHHYRHHHKNHENGTPRLVLRIESHQRSQRLTTKPTPTPA